jgi:hypothetical protein
MISRRNLLASLPGALAVPLAAIAAADPPDDPLDALLADLVRRYGGKREAIGLLADALVMQLDYDDSLSAQELERQMVELTKLSVWACQREYPLADFRARLS